MTFASLAARNILRNKVRTFLTILGVAVAILTFLLLRTVVSAWTGAADFAAKDRVVTRHKVTFIMQLPRKYIDKVRANPEIKQATWANWFGGKDPAHDSEFFANFAVDPESYFEVYDELKVDPDVLGRWKEDKSGAIVGDVLAKKLGWNVGDKISLESGIYPTDPDAPWTFTIAGTYTTTSRTADRSSFIFHWDYLNDNLPRERADEVGWIVSRVTDPNRTAAIGVDLDKVFDVEDVQTLSQDEHAFSSSFLAGFSAVLSVFDMVSVVIMFILMLILGNTIAMGVRERTSEYGAMRAIGFLPKHIAGFILIEAGVLGLLGGLLGLLIAFPFVDKGLGKFLEENMGGLFPFFRISIPTAILSLVIAVLLGVAAAALPAFRASRIPIVDALRRVV